MSESNTELSPQFARMPAVLKEAYAIYQASPSQAALDKVVLLALKEHLPRPAGGAEVAEPQGPQRLIDDLGCDSLAIAELVFLLEELFKVSVSNTELLTVRTVDELLAFVRRKVGVTS